MIEIADLSSFQSPAAIDYDKLATSVQAVIVKATDGKGSPDPAFATHVSRCHDAGLEAGAYHFLRARKGRPQDATEQAQEFSARYLGAGCTLLPCLDIEDPPETPQAEWASPEEYAEAIHDFLTALAIALPGRVSAYSYPYFWGILGAAVRTAELAATISWWADYTHQNPIAPGPWNAVPLIHQYTETGRVNGYAGNVDLSRSSASVADLRRVADTTTLPAA